MEPSGGGTQQLVLTSYWPELSHMAICLQEKNVPFMCYEK